MKENVFINKTAVMNDKFKRSIRRSHYERIKTKFEKILSWSDQISSNVLNGSFLGKTVSTHGKACSCHMCGNPRKYFKQKTIQELRSDIDRSSAWKDLIE